MSETPRSTPKSVIPAVLITGPFTEVFSWAVGNASDAGAATAPLTMMVRSTPTPLASVTSTSNVSAVLASLVRVEY